MADTSIHIQFCDGTVTIECLVPDLHYQLKRYFRHCLGAEGAGGITTGNSACVTYRIIEAVKDPTTFDSEGLQLWCGDELVHPNPSSLYVFTYLMQHVMNALITQCRSALVFHAAGVVHREQGIMLSAESGSGKSTISSWATATGFDFLSDEVIAIDGASLEMRGITAPIVLKRGSAFVWQTWVGEDTEERMPHFFAGTAWVDPEQLRPGCVRSRAPLKYLIFPRYVAEAPFSAQPLSAAETVFRLMHQLVNFDNLPAQGFTAVSHLARQIKAYSLTYSDVSTVVAWLNEKVTASHLKEFCG